jgi:hypothetical protein
LSPTATIAAGKRKATLTREHVIEKILRWEALYGEPPCTADWNPSLARWRAQEWRIERYRLGDPESGDAWPSINAAKRLFGGSFDAAVREAGLVPHRPGPRRRRPRSAAPAVEQRLPREPRDLHVELDAALERARDAERRARRATHRAERAEARLDELRTGGGPVGPGPLVQAVREAARANAVGDRRALHRALTSVAVAAVRWRERL